MTMRAYPAYKPSGVHALGEIPSHWSTPHLGHISTCLDYLRIPLNASERADRPGDVPYWGANGVVGAVDRSLVDGPLVLLGEDGAPFFDRFKDKAFYIDSPIWPNNHIHVLRPSTAISGRFLTHALNATDYSAWIEGSTRDKLTQGNMTSIPIPLPPRHEQDAIADFLNRETAKIDALIAKQEQLIATLREDRTATITHAVTKGLDPDVEMKDSGVDWIGKTPRHWGISRIRYACDLITGFPFASEGFTLNGNDLPLLRGANVGVDRIDWTDVVYWPEADAPKFADYELRVGDIAMGLDRPFIGAGIRVARIGPEDIPSLLLQRVARMRATQSFTQEYLFLLLSGPGIVHHLTPMFTGVSVPHVSPSQVESLAIPQPPLDEQSQIADYVKERSEKIGDLMVKAQEMIGRLREYRSALITDAVTGKIDVRAVA